MIKSLLPFLVPTSTAFISWLFAFFYYKKERQNELSLKLILQVEELSDKYMELYDKYTKLHIQMCKLQKENNQLKDALHNIEQRRN